MNFEERQIQFLLTEMDTNANYDYLFDFYGINDTCPIIQNMMETKKKLNVFLSEKVRYCVEKKPFEKGDTGTEFRREYGIFDAYCRFDFWTHFCGECGNFMSASSIHDGFIDLEHLDNDERTCKCYLKIV